MSNLQYTFRIKAIQEVKKLGDYDYLWTGWGDINGFPSFVGQSELFSEFLISLYQGKIIAPLGFSREWLNSYNVNDNEVFKSIYENPTNKTMFDLKRNLIAPRIFGTVINQENTLININAPWFLPKIYNALHKEELIASNLISSKGDRSIWKGELYYSIIKKYKPEFNRIVHSKGYYPWMLRKKYGFLGLGISFLMKKMESKKVYSTDKTENLTFIVEELLNIFEARNPIFNHSYIKSLLDNKDNLSGSQIFIAFKIIQVNWMFKLKLSENTNSL